MTKTPFSKGYTFCEGVLIVDGIEYVGEMPVEARAASMDGTITRIEMRWGTAWYDNIEDVVDAGLLCPAGYYSGTFIDSVGDPPSTWDESLASAVAAVDAIDKEIAELVDWLRLQTWSHFAQSVCEFYDEHGSLTAKQISSAKSMKSKTEARLSRKRTATKEADVPPPPKLKTGFYREGALLYRVNREWDVLYTAEFPTEPWRGFSWLMAAGDLPPTAVYLTTNHVIGFGILTGACLNCGDVLNEDDDGLHEGCAIWIYDKYGYTPLPDLRYETE